VFVESCCWPPTELEVSKEIMKQHSSPSFERKKLQRTQETFEQLYTAPLNSTGPRHNKPDQKKAIFRRLTNWWWSTRIISRACHRQSIFSLPETKSRSAKAPAWIGQTATRRRTHTAAGHAKRLTHVELTVDEVGETRTRMPVVVVQHMNAVAAFVWLKIFSYRYLTETIANPVKFVHFQQSVP